jgi:hypothetical protein
LFGAVNLLQASGKVLAETTETTQSRLNEAIGKLLKGDILPAMPTTNPQVENLVASLEATQKKLDERLEAQTQAAKAQIDLLTTQSVSLLSQSTTTAQTLSSVADHLRDEQSKFDQTLSQISGKLDQLGGELQRHMLTLYGATLPGESGPQNNQISELAAQVAQMAEKIGALGQAAPPAALTHAAAVDTSFANNLLVEMESGFETTLRSLSEMREQLANMVIHTQTQIPAPITADTREHLEQQTQILTELVATLGVLDAHMQEIRSQVAGMQG